MSLAYDVIGDVHGRFDKFESLMKQLGYTRKGRHFVPPTGHQAIFVGDLIDRGPEQVSVLEAVRGMVEEGFAQVVMGNHEFNAIAYTIEDPSSKSQKECLRKNRGTDWKCEQNRQQHQEFLEQVTEHSALHQFWLEWFRTLPFALDLGGFRVGHAWWDADAVAIVDRPGHRDSTGRLTDAFMIESHNDDSPLKEARKILTSGYEFKLPPGCFITDKAGHKHDNARLKIWKHEARSLRDLAIVPSGDTTSVPDLPIHEVFPNGLKPVEGSPIFIGHYWYTGDVSLDSEKVAVLDWSAANHGPLVAYRWEGEQALRNENFIAAMR